MSKRWWVIAVAALALLSLGCGLIGQLTGRLQEEYEKGSEAVATVQSMATQVTETGEEEGTTSGESTAEDEASESPGGGEADLPRRQHGQPLVPQHGDVQFAPFDVLLGDGDLPVVVVNRPHAIDEFLRRPDQRSPGNARRGILQQDTEGYMDQAAPRRQEFPIR